MNEVIIIKLDVHMYELYVTYQVKINDDIINDDVITSENRLKFLDAITLLIFKLTRRSKAQNVGNALDYSDNIPNLW